MAHQMQCRPGLRTAADGVAGVAANRCGGPRQVGRLGQMLLAHRRVALKAAGGQHHAFSGANAQRLSVALQDDTGHPAFFEQQRLHRRLEPDWQLACAQRGEQPPHQRQPAGQAPVARRLKAPWQVEPVAQQGARCEPGGARLAGDQLAGLEGVDQNPTEDLLPWVGVAQLRQRANPKPCSVEGLRVHRAATGQGVADVRIVVGVARHRPVGNAYLVKIACHVARCLDIGEHPVVTRQSFGTLAHIGKGRFDAVAQAMARHIVVVRNPNRPARDGRCAAYQRGLLDDQHRQPGVGGAHSGEQRAGTRANHHQVKFLLAGGVHISGRKHVRGSFWWWAVRRSSAQLGADAPIAALFFSSSDWTSAVRLRPNARQPTAQPGSMSSGAQKARIELNCPCALNVITSITRIVTRAPPGAGASTSNAIAAALPCEPRTGAARRTVRPLVDFVTASLGIAGNVKAQTAGRRPHALAPVVGLAACYPLAVGRRARGMPSARSAIRFSCISLEPA